MQHRMADQLFKKEEINYCGFFGGLRLFKNNETK